MSELVKFAKSELRAAGLFDEDADYDGEIAPVVVSLMETFTAYGHSGGSASRTLAIFDKLARHIPITPLTGEDDEWREYEGIWQNTRYHTVFKDKDGVAWDTANHNMPVHFPYTVEE
jgi:hypothetical protein